jgi:hypothetical protein
MLPRGLSLHEPTNEQSKSFNMELWREEEEEEAANGEILFAQN